MKLLLENEKEIEKYFRFLKKESAETRIQDNDALNTNNIKPIISEVQEVTMEKALKDLGLRLTEGGSHATTIHNSIYLNKFWEEAGEEVFKKTFNTIQNAWTKRDSGRFTKDIVLEIGAFFTRNPKAKVNVLADRIKELCLNSESFVKNRNKDFPGNYTYHIYYSHKGKKRG